MRIGVFAGSFDPVTLGHADIIKRAAGLFDCLYVAVSKNPSKQCRFTAEERLHMLDALFENELSDVSAGLRALIWDRPLFELCGEVGAGFIVKGARNGGDFEYERTLDLQTKSVCGGVDTVILPASAGLEHISSTFARGVIDYGMDLKTAMPASVAEQVAAIAGRAF